MHKPRDCAAMLLPAKPPRMTILTRLMIGAALMAFSATGSAQAIDAKVQARIDRILKATPLIDGHNDLPWELRQRFGGRVDRIARDTDKIPAPAIADEHSPGPLMTDIARLHQGRVGGQFWSVYIPSDVTGDAAIRTTLEQIDIVQRMVKADPLDLALAGCADLDVRINTAC
jgi:membrane dipeptidase